MNKHDLGSIAVKFLRPLVENKKALGISILYFLSDAIVNIGLLYFFKEITDTIESGIGNLLYLFIFFVVLKFAIIIFFRRYYAYFYPEMRGHMYGKYLSLFLKLDNNKTETYGTGKIISIIEKGILVWIDQFVNFFRNFLSSILNFLFALILVFGLNISYGLILLGTILFGFFIVVLIQEVNKKYRIERREYNIEISRRIVNFITSKFEILQNDKGESEVIKVVSILENNKRVNYKISDNFLIVDIFENSIIFGVKIAIVLFFLYGYQKGLFTLGDFVLLVSFSYILEKSLTSVVTSYHDISNAMVDIEKLWDFFDSGYINASYEDGRKFQYKNGDIEFKNMSYYYHEGKKIFENFDLKIPGGKIFALVGNSGSGKSTLVKLMAGYIHPQNGEIFIDGQKLSEISLKSLYKNIGYLTQEPSVFDGSIDENLLYAVGTSVSDEQVKKAILDANCEFIYDLPSGLKTQIGERGVKLSGGQKQRLAIAKIMLKNPKIIILDEPTSALDSFSEEQITKAMRKLFEGRTVIVIAHRLQTVKHADTIIVLEDGKVIEKGNHGELVARKGQYAKMLELQSGF